MPLLRRVLNLFLLSKVDREIDAELRSHIEMRIEDNLARHMTHEAARRDALLRFGNFSSTREHVAAADAALTAYGVWLDARYAFRQLCKNPGFAFTAILVLALGVCAGVAIFSFVDAVLIQPLPYENPARLVAIFESTPLGKQFHLSYLDYLDWKNQNKSFRSLDAYDGLSLALNSALGTELVDGATVSSGFFRTLGVVPAIGRDFRDGEDAPSAARTVILSYPAWQKRFGTRRDILGHVVTLEGVPYSVIGVLPRSFQFAPVGQAEFWTALHLSPNAAGRGEHGLSAIGRLKEGVSLASASFDMSTIAQELARQYPDADEGRGATLVALSDVIVGDLRSILWLLLSGAMLLLLIAAVNVCGLILVRSENRRHEIAVRGALGASRLRLVRQFVIEGVMLASTAGIIGLGAAYGLIRLLVQLVPPDLSAGLSYLQEAGLTLHVLEFATGIGITLAVLSSLAPTLRLSSNDLRLGLGENGRAASTAWRKLGANLVVLELCLAMVLLAGGGLLARSFYRLLRVDIGIEPGHLAMMRVRLPHSHYPDNRTIVSLTKRVLEETGCLPGVQSVAVAHQISVANVAGGNTGFEIIGRPRHGASYESSARQVGSTYFSTVQARLARGRYFTEADNSSSPPVMIVNQTFAQKYFPGEDAIGKHIRYDADSPPIEIVGIVSDIREGPLDAEVQPALYTPFDQEPDSAFYVVVRTTQAPQEMPRLLESTVRQIDPDILTFHAETMEDRIQHLQSSYLHRSSAWLVSGFAALALLLGGVGLYSLVAYSVKQRTREIGVRMALGARRISVYGMILKEAGKLTAVGIVSGIVCSVCAASLMRKFLFGTAPWDPGTLTVVAAVLAACALLASYLPARRAASVDPVEALRSE